MTYFAPRWLAAVALGGALVAAPLTAQTAPASPPGKADAARVTAGTYALDPMHTLVTYTVDHLGFTPYQGTFGDIRGTMRLDPARPAAARVEVTIPAQGLVNASSALTKHMLTPDFLDAAKFPEARFVSTRVTRSSPTTATIAGTLTLRGVTRPVVLAARFYGAGKSMAMGGRPARDTVGFTATTTIKRSDFGMTYGLPGVGDRVKLDIAAAFEKQ